MFAPFAVSEKNEYYSCLGYGMSTKSGAETPLPEEWSRWLKWRLFDLKETQKAGELPDNMGKSFQSVKVELVNAVPIVTYSPGRAPGQPVTTTDQLKVFTTNFALSSHYEGCVGSPKEQIAMWKPGSEEWKLRQYACAIYNLADPNGVVTKGKCGNVHTAYDYECSWLVDIEEKTMSISAFDNLFKE